jgi:hypothetical protein
MAGNIARSSWFGRNWKWVVAVLLGLILLTSALVIVGLNNSEATKLALATATSDPALVERLGQPMKAGWFIGGSIETMPGSGKAKLSIPISGPKGKGTVYTRAVKEAGIWRLTFLQFGADGEPKRIQLLHE